MYYQYNIMPIIEYDKESTRAEQFLLNNKKISRTNKNHVKRFLLAYNVKPARKAIFCKQIKHYIERFKDVSAFSDENLGNKKSQRRDEINQFFKEIRNTKKSNGENISKAYFETILNVTLSFAKWLNDDLKPYAFKDIKSTKKDQLRNLSRSDMIEPEERDLLIKRARGTQLKAIIALQLDAGLRPSEFIDLKIEDIGNPKGEIINIEIKDGKTGSRDVQIYYSVPHILRWIEEHPTGNPKDPLWIVEQPWKSSRQRNKEELLPANMKTIVERIKNLFKELGIKKPSDFYNLRHSAVFLSKLENTPAELAATKFGHSITYYQKVYGRLTSEDRIEQFRKHHNKKPDEEQTITCPKCNFINPPKTKVCKKCSSPLTLKDALQYKSELDHLKKRMAVIEKLMNKAK